MGYGLYPYAIDEARLAGLYGCRDAALEKQVLRTAKDEFDELDDMFEDDAPPAAEVWRDLVAGKRLSSGGGGGAMAGYVLREAIRVVGRSLGCEVFDRTSSSHLETVENALEKADVPLRLSPSPPKWLPPIEDFPMIIVVPPKIVRASSTAMKRMKTTDVYLLELSRWLSDCGAKEALVLFYH